MRRQVIAALCAALVLGACTSTPTTTPGTPPPGTSVSSTAPGVSPSATNPTTTATTLTPTTTETPVPDTLPPGTAIRLAVDGTAVAATLDDNPSAQDLLAQLPLTLTVRDYNQVEKTAVLPAALTLDGAPRGSDPAPFDIGYYAPDQVLVLYYRDVGFFNGIVALGRFDPAAAGLIEELPDDTVVTIQRA